METVGPLMPLRMMMCGFTSFGNNVVFLYDSQMQGKESAEIHDRSCTIWGCTRILRCDLADRLSILEKCGSALSLQSSY